ncbi:hypothetical protein ASG39_19680 [Rhizobium sp. Leaf371]|nr:hypothetical protein ASG39_19680 [Rhizobium sp. Leaf371]
MRPIAADDQQLIHRRKIEMWICKLLQQQDNPSLRSMLSLERSFVVPRTSAEGRAGDKGPTTFNP